MFDTGHTSRKVQENKEGIDRRIQKTKKILSESLIALILEKGFEKVTIQEIIDRANVGRSTFYTHYENKEQLLLAGPENLGVSLWGNTDGQKSHSSKEGLDFLPLFLHARENAALAKAMFGRKSGELFNGHLLNHLSEGIKEKFKSNFGKTKQDKLWLQYQSRSAAAAVLSLLVSWLEDDMPFAAEEIAKKCERVVAAGFK